jgi:hypothetical protein
MRDTDAPLDNIEASGLRPLRASLCASEERNDLPGGGTGQMDLEPVGVLGQLTQPAEVAKWYAPDPRVAPPEPADAADAGASQAPRGLPVYEQWALDKGLGGPTMWEDSPERRARDEARRRQRFIDC